MRKISDNKQIQKMEIDILNFVTELCEKNQLTYYLAGGTLLGAIRHNGFIPWDNDVDIAMPRADYKKLCALFDNIKNSRYKIYKIEKNNDCYIPFFKIVDSYTRLYEKTRGIYSDNMGLFIDVFPIDGIENNEMKSIKKLRRIIKWTYRVTNCNTFPDELSTKKKMIRVVWYIIFCKILNREKIFEYLNKKMEEIPFGSTEYVVSTFGARMEKEIIEYSAFAQIIQVEFEGRMYNAPIGYDKYLTQMYGDYMKLPPESERVAPHDIDVYIKEAEDKY